MSTSKGTFIAAGVIAVVGVFCGIAFAAVTLPFSGDGNTINGCYSDSGQVVLLTPSVPQCPKKYQPIQWNVTGPQGQPGTNGANGTNGTNGISPTVTQLDPGNANCPAGGAAITDASNTTAYACSGTPFSGTFTAGDYSISVTSSGITLAGPSSEEITLTNSGITVDGGPGTVKAKSTAGMTLESATAMDLKSPSTKVEGTAILDLKGALITLGGGCLPVARVSDQIVLNNPVSGVILTGSPKVLSC